MKNLWHILFLQKKPSFELSFFRIFAALATGVHVLPTFSRLQDMEGFIGPVRMSPDQLLVAMVWLFCIAWFCFLIGYRSQLSCILMTAGGCYFYALNSPHIGMLSWDILLATLFLMCLRPYHGDYFSVDCLRGRDLDAYRRQRPFFIQRMLQIQIVLAYLYTIYTGFDKISPVIFFVLFPPQLLLFVEPGAVVQWIERKRRYHQSAKRSRIIYDGNCGFCRHSLHQLKIMDLFDVFESVDFHALADPTVLHPQLTRATVSSQLHLLEPDGTLYGGFAALRRMSFSLPMLYPLIPLLYFPGMEIVGPWIYRLVAKNRYVFHANAVCRNNACFR